jgi:hypothetical protein
MKKLSLICLLITTLAVATVYAAGVNVLFRRGTAAAWTAANPILQNGEPGYETDTGLLKIGTGTATWGGLPYFSGSVFPSDPSITPVFVNASSSSQVVDLHAYPGGNVEVFRYDHSTTHTVTVMDSTPLSVPITSITVSRTGVHYRLNSGVWYTDSTTQSGVQTYVNAFQVKQYLDYSVTSSVEISPYTDITVCKTDSTAGTITLTDVVHANSQPWDPISVQGECLHLQFSGSVWYRP